MCDRHPRMPTFGRYPAVAGDALAYGFSSRWLGDRVSFNPSAQQTCWANQKRNRTERTVRSPFLFPVFSSRHLFHPPPAASPAPQAAIRTGRGHAYFTMAWMIAMVLTVIPGSLSQSLFAEGSHNPARLKGGGGRRALLIALLLTLPAVGALSLMGEWLLHFLARLRPVRHRPAAHPGTIDLPGLYQQHFHDGQPGQKAGLPYPRAVRLSGGHISHSGIQAAGQNLY